jgi:mono/diheme cytochrome c family protein
VGTRREVVEVENRLKYEFPRALSIGLASGLSLFVVLTVHLAKPAQGTGEATTALKTVDTAFQDRILPLFDRNCLVCHGSTVQRAGLDLRTKQSVLRGGANGPVIRAGNAQQSLLFQLITHQKEPAMPMGGKLGENEIAAIAAWINSLAPNETLPEAGKHSTAIREPGSPVTEQDRQFWSFVKPVRPAIPRTQTTSWGRNEIDAFVLQALEKKGLKPAPPAEPATLLRRAYFDLTGLPPSPEEVEAFLTDRSPDAFERVVDRLLASPHYGERWGRHWLDLARYADSGGFEFDVDRPHAWRYRDYVIRSFNDDKPYDRFIQEQLAGDELQPGSPETLVATGFCRNGPTVDNANNEQTRVDELDDIVSTTSSVFMGLTVGCARCHDHKYDPVPQRDYYRLQAVFLSSQKTERLLGTENEQAAVKLRNQEIDKQIAPFKEKIADLEKSVRRHLLDEKVERFTRLSQQAGALAGEDTSEYQKELAARFERDVKLQPEEIEGGLSPVDRQARQALMKEVEKLNRTRPKPPAAVMAITNMEGKPPQGFLLKRGDYRQKGEAVSPGFLSVLSPASTNGTELGPGARLQLAQWLTDPNHPLTTRVAANRIWQYHFGRGLVGTASDFGVNGERPSHPELLDWLATEFMARRWSVKSMHRLIMTSSAYRQSSRWDAEAAKADAGNRLLWRFSPRRIEAENVRDSILVISGSLNREMGGPGIYPRIDRAVIGTGSTNKWPLDVEEGPATWRRSVYVFQKRSVVLPLLEVFDCPDSTVSSPSRSASTIAPQALALLNNAFVLQQSQGFARRVVEEAGSATADRADRAFQIALGRKASERELTWSLDFLRKQTRAYEENAQLSSRQDGSGVAKSADEAAFRALTDLCHAMFNLNEFLYVE